ncbi:MAG TPA: hypothetical protein VIJ91_04330, partial [Candidatus Dormibacteraeota bacterium]
MTVRPILATHWLALAVGLAGLAGPGRQPGKGAELLAGAEPSGPTDDRGHRRGADLGQAGQAGRQAGRIGPAVGVGARLGVP